MDRNTIDAPQSQLDAAVRIFNEFYDNKMALGAGEYELVRSYFKEISGSDNISNNFAVMLFRIANTTGKPVLDLLHEMKGQNKLAVTSTMAYYLNSVKSKVALYGVSNTPPSNPSVQRNIVV